MKILLPPSETKRIGGTGAPWSAAALVMPSLQPQRDLVVDALIALAADPEAASRVLKLSERQRGEITHNAALREAATMPAVDRYTGVLFDALGASTLPAEARRWLGQHVWIHSAPFGPVGALDPIPSYRLGAAVSLPGVPPLRRLWADAVSESIAASHPRFILDLRSEAYVALGPVPDSEASAYVRVVTDEEGSTRALNHFNKHAKGALVRRLAEDRPRIDSVNALFAWAERSDVTLRPTGTVGTIELVVPA